MPAATPTIRCFGKLWQKMADSPKAISSPPSTRDFGGVDKLKERFNAAGARVFGSGWVMVKVDKAGHLGLTATPNQDTPLMQRRACSSETMCGSTPITYPIKIGVPII